MAIPLSYWLILGAVFFGIGLYGALSRRNAISILLSLEIMLNGANLNLIGFSRYASSSGLNAQVFALFIMGVAAAEVAVGLALVLAVYRNAKTINVDEINIMKW